jgi:uncharacterized protein with ParB-like and HNH nuclease domain
MVIWKTYRIADIITEISDDKFVLPVIQRPLVWTEEKMELLFDTLLKGDSFGGVMVIEEEKDSKPLFNYRPFSKNGDLIPSIQIDKLTQLQNFVIDGQQRLQSFYIGLKGSINGKILYFDLYSDFNKEFEFRFENDIQKLPKKSPKPSEDEIGRTIRDRFWYPVAGLLEKLKSAGRHKLIVRDIIASNSIIENDKKEHIEENILAFYENVISSETLGVSKIIINKYMPELDNRQRIVELFKRLNQGGTDLSSFDLVASILKGFDWQMEAFLREMLESYKDIGLSQENLIKLIFILQDNHDKEMASIKSNDAEFAIKNRERIKFTLKALKDFLIHSKVYDYFKDGNRSFIPLFFIAYHIFHKQIDANAISNYFDNYDTGNLDFPKMKKWLFHSLLNGVFKSKGAGWIPYRTGIKKLLNEIKKHKNLDFPINELFKVYTNHPITFTIFYNTNNLDQLEGSFVYYLMYDRAKTIRANDIDHIMPKSILENLGYDWTKINSIKNFQLIDFMTNRVVKRAKPFKLWINNNSYVKDKSEVVYVKNKADFVELHLIPVDETLWTEDRFEEFTEERAKLILAKIGRCTS